MRSQLLLKLKRVSKPKSTMTKPSSMISKQSIRIKSRVYNSKYSNSRARFTNVIKTIRILPGALTYGSRIES